MDDRSHAQHVSHRLGLSKMAWQTVQDNQRMLVHRSMREKRAQDPFRQGKVLVLQQGAGLQCPADELNIIGRNDGIGTRLRGELAKVVAKVKMDAPPPCQSALLQPLPQRRLT
jgi:hypothetical protein